MGWFDGWAKNASRSESNRSISMNRIPLGSFLATLLFTALAGAIFLLDVSTPPGIGDGIGYSIPLVLSLSMKSKKAPILCALLVTALSTAGYFLHTPFGNAGEETLINRVLANIGIWLLCFFLMERKRVETLLAESVRIAKVSNAAKSSFLTSMSDELLTPVNAIIGFSDVISRLTAESNPSSEIIHTLAPQIHRNARSLRGLVKNILDAAAIEGANVIPDLVNIDIRTIIAHEIKVLGSESDKSGVKIELHIPECLPSISLDRHMIAQTLHQLLSNAIRFTPKGEKVQIRIISAENILFIEIGDTGIGIAATELPKLGTPFTKAFVASQNYFGGAGLGLSIAKSYTELQGGKFSIKSGIGVGTNITLAFPIKERRGVANSKGPSN